MTTVPSPPTWLATACYFAAGAQLLQLFVLSVTRGLAAFHLGDSLLTDVSGHAALALALFAAGQAGGTRSWRAFVHERLPVVTLVAWGLGALVLS